MVVRSSRRVEGIINAKQLLLVFQRCFPRLPAASNGRVCRGISAFQRSSNGWCFQPRASVALPVSNGSSKRGAPTLSNGWERREFPSKMRSNGLPTGGASNPPYPPSVGRRSGGAPPTQWGQAPTRSSGAVELTATRRLLGLEGGPNVSTRILPCSMSRCIARSREALPISLPPDSFARTAGA